LLRPEIVVSYHNSLGKTIGARLPLHKAQIKELKPLCKVLEKHKKADT
jgi:hypothetical protein